MSCIKFLCCGLCLSVWIGCGNMPSAWEGVSGPKVAASFAPIQCFALNVVGDARNVQGVLTTQGPHHADPPLSQARMLSGADLFLINGLGVDDSLAKKMAAAVGSHSPKVIKLANALPADQIILGRCGCCDHDHEDADHHHDDDAQVPDGHAWLGIDQACKMLDTIRDEVSSRDPSHAADYDQRTRDYTRKLQALKVEGVQRLKDKKNRTILPFHGSLAYFAKTFELKLIEPIQDVPGQEPTPKQIDAIIARCLKDNVRIIAVEPQYGAETAAKTIRNELQKRGLSDVQFVVIDPLETTTGEDFGPGWYEAKMRMNIETLEKAMK